MNFYNSVDKAQAKPWQSQEEEEQNVENKKEGWFRGTVYGANTHLVGVPDRETRDHGKEDKYRRIRYEAFWTKGRVSLN